MCGIIILNYNSYTLSCELVKKCINIKYIDRIVLIDNNSNDDFEQFLEKINDNKIVYIKNKTNSGYAKGNNIGLKYLYELGFDYAFIANPDVDFNETTIKNILQFMENNQEYGVVSCKRTIGENGITGQYWDIPSYWGCLWESLYIGRKMMDTKYKKNFEKIWSINDKKFLTVEVLGGAFFGCNLRIMNDINYFNEKTFLWYEENILAYKLREKNYKEALLLDCSYVHNHFKTKKGNSKHKVYLDSKYVYCKECLKIGFFKKILMRVFDFAGLIESKILCIIARIFDK